MYKNLFLVLAVCLVSIGCADTQHPLYPPIKDVAVNELGVNENRFDKIAQIKLEYTPRYKDNKALNRKDSNFPIDPEHFFDSIVDWSKGEDWQDKDFYNFLVGKTVIVGGKITDATPRYIELKVKYKTPSEEDGKTYTHFIMKVTYLLPYQFTEGENYTLYVRINNKSKEYLNLDLDEVAHVYHCTLIE